MSEYLLMRWDGVPLAQITNAYKKKIESTLHKQDEWYGYSSDTWKKAFKFKENAQKERNTNNLKAIKEMHYKRKLREYETQKAIYKLLYGICKGLNIIEP